MIKVSKCECQNQRKVSKTQEKDQHFKYDVKTRERSQNLTKISTTQEKDQNPVYDIKISKRQKQRKIKISDTMSQTEKGQNP